jgi:hypothetical protein
MEEHQLSMKTILMIGDSWGVPNYEGPKCGAEPHEHTENRLKKFGYKVYNCSVNGGSNIDTINLAKKFLSGRSTILEPISLQNKLYPEGIAYTIDKDFSIDVIVWFHTEFFRGPDIDYRIPINENIKLLAHNDYKYVSEFFSQYPSAKKIVIGGQSPVITDILFQYINPDYLIADWRSEIVEQKLPEVHTLSRPKDWVDRSIDDIEFKIDLLGKHKILFDAMYHSADFPDNCHPGGKAHEVLSNRIHSIL